MFVVEMLVGLALIVVILVANESNKKILKELQNLSNDIAVVQGLIIPPDIYVLPVVKR
jgi:hypothetical protein